MLSRPDMPTALALSPMYFGGVWLGGHLFGRLDAATMRRGTLVFLVIVSGAVFLV